MPQVRQGVPKGPLTGTFSWQGHTKVISSYYSVGDLIRSLARKAGRCLHMPSMLDMAHASSPAREERLWGPSIQRPAPGNILCKKARQQKERHQSPVLNAKSFYTHAAHAAAAAAADALPTALAAVHEEEEYDEMGLPGKLPETVDISTDGVWQGGSAAIVSGGPVMGATLADGQSRSPGFSSPRPGETRGGGEPEGGWPSAGRAQGAGGGVEGSGGGRRITSQWPSDKDMEEQHELKLEVSLYFPMSVMSSALGGSACVTLAWFCKAGRLQQR